MSESDEVKKLYRSTDDQWLAGVCGGLAKYFNVDPTLVRVIFVVLALIGLGGVVIYLVLWVIVPPEPTEEEQVMIDHIVDEKIAEEEAESAGEEEAE
jgi:phage shock protein C